MIDTYRKGTKMKILLTGGTGLIGRALCKAFLADGYEVSVLTRNTEKALNALPSGVVVVQ